MSSDSEVDPLAVPPGETGAALDSPILDEVPAEAKPINQQRPWGFWMTTVWALVCLFVWAMIQVVVLFAFFAAGAGTINTLATNGNCAAVAIIASTPVVVGLIALLAWASRYPIRDYLALVWPDARSVVLSLVGLAVVLVGSDLMTYALGKPIAPEWMVDVYKTSWLPLLLLAIVVVAPVFEETMFRGFFYKGVACSPLGPVAAVLLSSALFAILHSQYDWYGVLCVAIIGLYLGWVRYKTGSVLLTIVLHGIGNLYATGEIIVQEHWLH
jgi:membrane protease YdiL (CAAX protease family)